MTNPNPDLAEIRNLPIAELAERLPALSAGQLTELRALEAAETDPRKGALEAIDAAIAKAAGPEVEGGNPPPAGKAGKSGASKPADDESAPAAPDWQSPDYSGPLDIEQATWRARHVKPVRTARTK